MFNTADYLHIPKRKSECAHCAKSIVEDERHLSILLDAEEADAWRASHAAAPEKSTAEAPTDASGDADAKGKSASVAKAQAEEEKPAFLRLDFCADCWEELQESEFFSFWMGRHNVADLPKKKLNRAERNLALVALFDSMTERNGEEADFTPHLYFLAHLLMKYKIFKWKPSESQAETGETILRFTRSDSEDEVRLPEIDMPSEMVVRVKDEVEAYLAESTGQPIKL